MEKFSQYRDRGSGIAPFFPISTAGSRIYLPFYIFLFLVRLPILITVTLSYFTLLQWFPIGSLGKKASLWLILGVPGIWWIDLRIDGVKKGSLAKHHKARLPQPSSIIASSFTSPIDSLYLAAIFDPVFAASYPSTRLVHRISLFEAILRAFQHPQKHPPLNACLTDLQTLLQQHPSQPVVVFPECTTTNGRGILPFSASLLTVPSKTKIFPISLRYTPADITTPVPDMYLAFFWNLLSRPTHCIRVRIAESVYNTSYSSSMGSSKQTSLLDMIRNQGTLLGLEENNDVSLDEKIVLDNVAEALARLGRVKRVGLSAMDKEAFVKAWTRQRRR
ncbi:hypothetical protein MMC29_002541 [Sticta canariensis]|nr:hypothetical protein [Sticta canariensis]